MPALSRLASDVRIKEVDLSTTISQNSNITAALVAVSSKGPIGPTLYTTFDDFRSDFGDPNAKVSFDHYAAYDFFKEGNGMWVTRAVNTDASTGGLTMYVTSLGVSTLAGTSLANPANVDWGTIVPVGATPLYYFYPKRGPGSYSSKLAIGIRSTNLTTPTNLAGTSATTGGSLASGSYSYQVSAISKTYNETIATAAVTVVVSSATTTNRVTLTWDAVPEAIGYKVYGRSTGSIAYIATTGGSTTTFVDDGLTAITTGQLPILNDAGLAAASTKFTVDVYDLDFNTTVPVESFDCSLDDQVDEVGLQTETAQRINPFSDYIRVASYTPALLTFPTVKSITKQTMGAGSAGSTPTASQVNLAWDLFRDKEKYVVDVLINAGRTSVIVQKHMDEVAQARFDCVAFLDLPAVSQKAQDAIDFRNLTLNLNSSFSAIFGSDLYVNDPISSKLLYVPPSGAMAGLLARTTRVSQPWFSIAGLNRGLVNVLDVRYTYTDGEATRLYQAQINYMRRFIGRGIPLWEQSTLYNKSSALQFLNVRVLCNVLKRSMYDFLLYSLQEPNDDILRKQIRFGLEDYLSYVQGGRGISAFRVTCNENNNTAAVINSGALAVAVYIVPILGTRQINLSLLIGKEGLQVSETDVANLTN